MPSIAMEDPMIPYILMGDFKIIMDAIMMTIRLMVFPTACVTG